MEAENGCAAFTKAVLDKGLPDDSQAQEFLFAMVPELKAMVGFEQNNIHHVYDVWRHTMKALSSAGDDAINLKQESLLFKQTIIRPFCFAYFSGIYERNNILI